MADKWEDKGYHAGSIADGILEMFTGDQERHVVNTETGEEKIVYVASGQSIGEAIANGQVRDDDCK